MARYRKKPVVIEAIQWDGLNLEEIRRFVGSSLVYEIFDAAWKAGAGQPVVDMKIKTLEGEMQVGRGDYIIKGVCGEFYPCKPDIFKETYESADAADVAPKSEVVREVIEFIENEIKAMEDHTPTDELDKAIGLVTWILLGVVDQLKRKYTEEKESELH